MAGKRSFSRGKQELSAEEYVSTLYQVLLKREPDDQGLASHVSALRENGDHTRILKAFLHSEEFKNVEVSDRHADVSAHLTAFDVPLQDPLHTDMVIECSRDHFDDVSFFENAPKRSKNFSRIKKKINTIAIYYPKMSNGGTERVTALQILTWIELGYRVILLTDLPADPLKDYNYGGVERFIIPPKMMVNNDYRDRGRVLRNILIDQNVDLFVNNLWDETSTAWDVLVAKSLGIATIVGWHNIFDTRIRSVDDIHLANVRFTGYRCADLITVLSVVDKLWFRERGVAARVVYNPLTFSELPAELSPLTGMTVVWVARAERHQKRLDLAIRMFSLVLAEVPNAQLLIVGGGPDLEWAREYARSLGIGRSVKFTGYTTDVAKYLAKADVHILTSEFEGWCLALGEAWAYGVPSVMFKLPYLEYVQSGDGYIAVEMLDISAMAKAVTKLLLEPELRKTLGRAARGVIERFDQVSFAEEWRQIFEDIETRDNLDIALLPESELRGLRALTTVLGDRFMSFDNRVSDNYLPVLPSAMRLEKPRTKRGRKMLRAARAIAAPYISIKKLLNTKLIPDRRLRMIDLSHVGLGDNIMIWTGLFTLLNNGVPLCAPGCVLHVQPVLADLASCLFTRFGLVIQRGRPAQQVSPIYSPLAPASYKEWWNTFIGRDWRMNWVEALDLQKSFPRQGSDLSFSGRVRLLISERLLYRRHDWSEAVPSYIGYRVWLPLALKHGVYPVVFMSQLKRSLADMRVLVGQYVDGLTPRNQRARYFGNAAFPTGKSFQTIPPLVFKRVNDALGGNFFTCYVQNDSPWWGDYETAGVTATNLSNIVDTLRIIKYSKNLLTTDSFTSHVAQLMRDNFVLVLSRDMREGVVHPGSNPQVIANHPACAPCNYQERYHFDRCVAGHSYCIAFHSDEFTDSISNYFK